MSFRELMSARGNEPLQLFVPVQYDTNLRGSLVLHAGSVQGFYLPAESNYSPLPQPVSLPPEEGMQR